MLKAAVYIVGPVAFLVFAVAGITYVSLTDDVDAAYAKADNMRSVGYKKLARPSPKPQVCLEYQAQQEDKNSPGALEALRSKCAAYFTDHFFAKIWWANLAGRISLVALSVFVAAGTLTRWWWLRSTSHLRS